ncbi:unnamed protein product, partial [Rotaria socialis]
TQKAKSPLQTLDINHNNTDIRVRQDSSSASSFMSRSESDQNNLPRSSGIVQEIDSDNVPDDFLTFIEQKTKAK